MILVDALDGRKSLRLRPTYHYAEEYPGDYAIHEGVSTNYVAELVAEGGGCLHKQIVPVTKSFGFVFGSDAVQGTV